MTEESNLDAYKLSEDAWVVLGSWFHPMKVGSDKSELTMHMRVSKPHPRTQAALDELVAKGVISHRIRTPAESDQGSHTYQPLVDCWDAFGWMYARLKQDDGGAGVSWPLMVPVDGIDKPLPGMMIVERG